MLNKRDIPPLIVSLLVAILTTLILMVMNFSWFFITFSSYTAGMLAWRKTGQIMRQDIPVICSQCRQAVTTAHTQDSKQHFRKIEAELNARQIIWVRTLSQ